MYLLIVRRERHLEGWLQGKGSQKEEEEEEEKEEEEEEEMHVGGSVCRRLLLLKMFGFVQTAS